MSGGIPVLNVYGLLVVLGWNDLEFGCCNLDWIVWILPDSISGLFSSLQFISPDLGWQTGGFACQQASATQLSLRGVFQRRPDCFTQHRHLVQRFTPFLHHQFCTASHKMSNHFICFGLL